MPETRHAAEEQAVGGQVQCRAHRLLRPSFDRAVFACDIGEQLQVSAEVVGSPVPLGFRLPRKPRQRELFFGARGPAGEQALLSAHGGHFSVTKSPNRQCLLAQGLNLPCPGKHSVYRGTLWQHQELHKGQSHMPGYSQDWPAPRPPATRLEVYSAPHGHTPIQGCLSASQSQWARCPFSAAGALPLPLAHVVGTPTLCGARAQVLHQFNIKIL